MTSEFDAVLEETGRWQVALLLLLSINYGIVGMNHALPTFHGYTPPFNCQGGEIQGCPGPGNGSQPGQDTCPQGYNFTTDRGDATIATEWSLVCDRRLLGPLTATLYFCGVTLGAVVCGLLTDRHGRKPVMLACLYAQGALGLGLYFAGSLHVFMAVRFVQGFFVQGLQGATYTLLMELFPAKLRTAVGVILELYWALGLITLAGASYFFPHWRHMQLVLTIPTAFTVTYAFAVPESIRWLTAKGRIEEARREARRILRFNWKCGQTLDRPTPPESGPVEAEKPPVVQETVELKSLTERQSINNVSIRKARKDSGRRGEDVKGSDSGVLQLFQNRVLRKLNLIMTFVWFSVSLSYYGIMFYLPGLSGERHLNFVLGALLELLSFVLSYVILSRYGRRLPLTCYLVCSGATCIAVGATSVVSDVNASWIEPLRTTLALFGKAAVVSSFCCIFIYTSELFPTVLRAAATGYCGLWGRMGSLLAPQLLLLGEYTSTIVPLGTMGVLCGLAGLATLALPETLNRQLADTVLQTETAADRGDKTEIRRKPEPRGDRVPPWNE